MSNQASAARIEAARRQRARFFDPFTGKLHVLVAGGSDVPPPTPPAPPEPATPPPAPAPSTPPAALTQADVDRAKRDAAKAAKAEADAAFKAMLEEAKANEEREKLDAQTRAEAERDDARAKLEAAEARAAKVEHNARVHRMLMAEGVPADAVERVALMVTAEPGASDDDIKGDIDKIRDLGIGVFSTKTEPTATAPGTKPTSQPAPRTGGESEYERGVREAKERRAYLQSA
jgi:hypothetical protein